MSLAVGVYQTGIEGEQQKHVVIVKNPIDAAVSKIGSVPFNLSLYILETNGQPGFSDNPLPCLRCIEQGNSHTCVEGARKQPASIHYSVEVPILISTGCQLDQRTVGERNTQNSATTVEGPAYNSFNLQSKPATEIRSSHPKRLERSLLSGSEYTYDRKENPATQPLTFVSENVSTWCATECSTLNTEAHEFRSPGFCDHISSEVRGHEIKCPDQTFSAGRMLPEIEPVGNFKPFIVRAEGSHLFPEETSYPGFAISSGWASTFWYPESLDGLLSRHTNLHY